MVIDGKPIGRIYADRLPGGEKWLWFLHILRAHLNTGIADNANPSGGHYPSAEMRAAIITGNEEVSHNS